MKRWPLVILVTVIGCSSPKSGGLPGDYVAWTFLTGKPLAEDGSQGITQRLTLNGDGTYKMVIDSKVMVTTHLAEEGTYRLSGRNLELKGTAKIDFDDGYKKSSNTESELRRLRVENGDLILEDELGPIVFRKKGSGAPPVPKQLQLGKSDPAAIALLRRITKNYSGMQSFRAMGTLKSNGGGFSARDAKFEIVFRRPSSFRFEAISYTDGKQRARTEITWSGGQTCRWVSSENGAPTEERALGNALSIESVPYGDSALLLPSLLLPKEVGPAELGADREVKTLPDETIRGKLCAVVQIRSRNDAITKLWIDRSSGTIVRSFNDITEQTMELDSVVGANDRR